MIGREHSVIIIAAALLVACSSSAPLSRRDNLAYIYGKGSAQMPLQARVHHIGDERSRIYFKLNTADLLYKSDGTGGLFHAKVRIRYEAYDSFGAKAPLDSASTLIDDSSPEPTEEKDLIGSMDLRRTHQHPFVLKVVAHDLNRDLESAVFLRVERDGELTSQSFMPVDTSHGLPYFTDHFKGGTVRVRCEVCTGKELTVRHHPARTTLPAPVFTSTPPVDPAINAPADSTFRVRVDADGHFKLDLRRPGAYRILTDTSAAPSYSLHSITEAYPIVTTTDDLLKPLRYITSNQEYDRIVRSDDVRKAIERFWVDAAGDRERGREAIRIYYGRVENANRHFTAEAEGWRTDRGLVHIIFGVPTSIYKTDLGETWIYGEENNLMSLVFNFKRRDQSTDMNDLVLERDPLLKGAWYRNVESWRNGRVYQN
ncbi:MAG: GWxTD domain-containing protein [Flavobacteriales bacterium]|nr:GWxTD domain-containing protein [Flavobacteriales bacterium]